MALLDIPHTPDGLKAASTALHTGGTPEQLQTEIEKVLIHQVENTPRSLQKRIGPSEIGMDCDHCLAARLAGWEKQEKGLPWASTVGTAIHEKLENYFRDEMLRRYETSDPNTHQYWTEQTVEVGEIGGVPITGSTDLLDVKTGATVDWKCVSKTSLANYKRNGPSQQYRVQANLYAKGWNDAGIPVSTVAICFLPRTTNNFFDRWWWTAPYEPQIATDALQRANQLNNNLAALAAISTTARDEWISNLPRADRCWDCPKYADWQAAEPSPLGLDHLIKI